MIDKTSRKRSSKGIVLSSWKNGFEAPVVTVLKETCRHLDSNSLNFKIENYIF